MGWFECRWVSRGNLVGLPLMAALLAVATPGDAADTVKIYRSTMPDGSVVLSDKPSRGARSVASETYVLTAPRGAAEAERDYWRRQADAFNLRQQQRDVQSPARRQSPRVRRDGPAQEEAWLALGSAGHYDEHRHGGRQYAGGHDGRPIVPLNRVPRPYVTSPGAVNSRGSGFIGSGFSTAR